MMMPPFDPPDYVEPPYWFSRQESGYAPTTHICVNSIDGESWVVVPIADVAMVEGYLQSGARVDLRSGREIHVGQQEADRLAALLTGEENDA